jgi:uncharacterized protein YjbI with pentapeptide repeats
MITSQHLDRAARLVEAAGGLYGRLVFALQRFKAPIVGYKALHVIWTQLRREQPGRYPDDVTDFYVLRDPLKFVMDHEAELSVQPDWAKWVPWLVSEFDRLAGMRPDLSDAEGFLLAGFPKLVKWMRKNRPDVNKLDLQEVIHDLEESHDEPPPQGETVHTESDGWTVQKLTTKEQLDAEGEYLQHCVGSYYDKVNDGRTSIYSLRDLDGFPHVTIEYLKTDRGHRVSQIQARGNQFPEKHVNRLRDVVRTVLDSDAFGLILLGEDPRTLKLVGADLSGISLYKANLSGVDLSGAYLDRAEMEEIDLEGSNLSGANLLEANLRYANLAMADLPRANLSMANLVNANLRHANLSEANLSWTDLVRSDLRGANLSGAHMSGSDLMEAILLEANLSGADLSGTKLYGANLYGVNLRGSKWDDSTEWPDQFKPPKSA